jgi:hypothetical protein
MAILTTIERYLAKKFGAHTKPGRHYKYKCLANTKDLEDLAIRKMKTHLALQLTI